MNRLTFYHRHYSSLFEPLLALMLHGVRVDLPKLQARYEKLRARAVELGGELNKLTGSQRCLCGEALDTHATAEVNIYEGVLKKDGKPRKPKFKVTRPCPSGEGESFRPRGRALVSKTNVSAVELTKWLYDVMKLPEQRAMRERGKEATRTGSELALLRLQRVVQKWLGTPSFVRARAKVPWKRKPKTTLKVIKGVLEHQRVNKLATFARPTKVDADGRIRCQYKFTTATLRLASSKNPLGTGYNLQNVDREIRDCFIPDEGCVFVEGDFSQGETRLLYAMSGDPEMLQLAQASPAEVDIYVENATKMFGVRAADVTKGQRQESKQATLASGYLMGAARFSELFTLAGTFKSEVACEKLLADYFAARPGVQRYQRWIKEQIMRKRLVQAPSGWCLDFRNQPLTSASYKEGCAFLPQHTLGSALNQQGLKPLYHWLKTEGMRSRINLQVHDALVLSCPPTEVFLVLGKMREEMEKPLSLFTTAGKMVELSIPVCFKVGLNWAFSPGVEFKKLPSEKEVQQCLRLLGIS